MKAKDEWFDHPDNSHAPLLVQLQCARLNLDIARDLTCLNLSDYRTLIEVRSQEVDRLLDLIQDGPPPDQNPS